jgi:isoquinoline 1-oxidoreductase alpha subunit
MIQLSINGRKYSAEVDTEMPLLWLLRDVLGLRGTKYACGIGQCGTCTVHVDGIALRACALPVGQLIGRQITTIEGLSKDGEHPVQKAWRELSVPQCGYCQPGQIMNAAALLADKPSPTDDEIDGAMAGNLCRCGTYKRIRRAIRRASEEMS